MAAQVLSPRELSTIQARTALRAFLRTGARLDLTPLAAPRVSIVILVHNRAELTLRCLQSLVHAGNRTPCEIIVVDNGSTDETGALLGRLAGVRIVANPVNLGFPKAVNQGARLARANHLLLLNNDAEVLGRSIDHAVAFLDRHGDVGAVGGKVVLLDGTLQEAGCGIWQDGWGFQHGRGGDPDDPAYSFRRDVDYCSAAFLMTRTALFHDVGGLDETFSPGYFEDTDYSIRLWERGQRIVFLPEIVTLHHENGTSSSLFNPHELCSRHHRLFADRYRAWLSFQGRLGEHIELETRHANDIYAKFLLLHEGPVTSELRHLVRCLERLDCFITLAWLDARGPSIAAPAADLPDPIEVIPCESRAALVKLLDSRRGYYDILAAMNADQCGLLEMYRSRRTRVVAYSSLAGYQRSTNGT